MNMKPFLAVVSGIVLLSTSTLCADTFVWNTNSAGNWTDSANWTGATGYPGQDDRRVYSRRGAQQPGRHYYLRERDD